MVAPTASWSTRTANSVTLRVDTQPGGGATPVSWRVDRTSTTAPGAANNVCTISAVLGSCTDTGLSANTAYTYVVRSVRNNWVSATTVGSTVSVSTLSAADTTAPTVASVDSNTADGAYKALAVIGVTVNFSESVIVTGTPRLTLETGTTDRVVNYTSGSTTSQLLFNYTVQSGDTSADLDYVATTSLGLNGGTIKDAAGNNAVLTLATPGQANSLGANRAIVIDTTAPTAASFSTTNATGHTVGKIESGDSVTFVYSEAIRPQTLLSGWDGSTTATITVRGNDTTTDTLTFFDSANAAQLPIKTLDLKFNGFFTDNVTYSSSTIQMLDGKTIKVTMGTLTTADQVRLGTQNSSGDKSKPVWTPNSAVTDPAGNACDAATVEGANAQYF
jgi:hypothetical protein